MFCPGVPFNCTVREDGEFLDLPPIDRALLEHDRQALVAFGPGHEEALDPIDLERAFDEIVGHAGGVEIVDGQAMESTGDLARGPEKVITITAPIDSAAAALVTPEFQHIAAAAFAREVDRVFLGFTPRHYLRPEDLCLARVRDTFCARRREHPADERGHLSEDEIYLKGDPDVAPPRGILANPAEDDCCACPLQPKPHRRDYLKCDPESRWLP
jgi:hypothetical protein